MKSKRRTKAGTFLASMTAALAVVLAPAAGAAAPPSHKGFELARFKVEIEGYSNTTWHRSVEAENDCESSDHSFGRERFTFATKKPFVIMATHFPGEFNPQIFSGRSALGVPVEAKIRRSYTPAITMPASSCEDNGGGAEPVRPDCGSRTVRNWHVEVEFSEEKKNGLQLHGDTGSRSPYSHCPAVSFTFPFLLDEDDPQTDKPVYADLSPDELFDRKLQKWITIGNGSFEDAGEAFWSKTDVHWTVSFTRLKGK